MSNLKNKLLLLIIPVIVFILVTTLRFNNGAYYLGSNYDPSYAYLMNANNIAHGEAPGHVDHPGTTIQVIGAFSILIKYVFSNEEGNLSETVIQSPESYLFFVSNVIVLIISVTLYILSYKIFSFSRKLVYAFVFQFSLVTNPTVLYFLVFVNPEPLLVLISLLYLYVLFRIYIKKDLDGNYSFYLKSLALISALGMATKINVLPLVIASIFLIARISYKKGYCSFYLKGLTQHLLLFLIIFVIMVFPALFSYQYLVHWIVGLVIGSEKYGGGEPIIISPTGFVEHLYLIFVKNPLFTFAFLLVLFLGVYLLRYKQKEEVKHLVQVLSFLIIAFVLQIFIVAKHYENHYLIPVLIFPPFVFLMAYNFYVKKKKFVLPLLIIIPICFVSAYRIILLDKQISQKKQEQLAVINEVSKYNYDCLFVLDRTSNLEASLHSGMFWSGKTRGKKEKYYEIYDKIYGQKVKPLHLADLKTLQKYQEHLYLLQTQTSINNNQLVIDLEKKEVIIQLKKLCSNSTESVYKITGVEESQ